MTDRGSPKVLVIGARVPGVPCARWFEGKLPNIADYDLLVANSLSLEAEMEKVPDGGNLSFEAHKHWTKRLEEIRERTRKLLKSGGEVVAIVGEEVIRVTEDPSGHGFPGFVSSLDWIPVAVGLHEERGNTVQVIAKPFERYMSLVGEWHYHLYVEEERMTRPDRIKELSSEHDAKHITVSIEPIAINRQKNPIAAVFTYGVHGGDWKTWTREVETWSGPLFILPSPTTTDSTQAVRVILEDITGTQFVAPPEPEWLSETRIHGEEDWRKEISSIEEQRGGLDARISELHEQILARRRFLSLLSADGMELQTVSRDAFEDMGFSTRDIDPEISDEFIVARGTDEFLIEVKGHVKSAQAEDVRQLDEAMGKYQKALGTPIKGVLLVNAWREIPPGAREENQSLTFPDNLVRRADAIDVTLISGQELLNALHKFWVGELNGDQIFETIMKLTGIVRF